MFIFSIEGMPVGFSGDGRRVGEAVVDGLMRLPVDFIALGENASAGAFPADGDCWFSDPYLGPAVIWCTALTRGGPFVAAFKTDGGAPAEQ